MKQKLWAIAAMTTFASLSYAQSCTCMHAQEDARMVKDAKRVEKTLTNLLLTDWKDAPKKVAETMITKYGQPHEATPTRMVWFNNGPWKFTILTNEEIPHNFPMHHHDMLRQGIDYKVPSAKFNDVLNYDGSIIVDRTPGEMSARCDKEEMNFLAINLAHDVATGKRTVDQARDFYAKTAMAFMKKSLSAEQKTYTSGFAFSLPKTDTGFADKPAQGGSGNR